MFLGGQAGLPRHPPAACIWRSDRSGFFFGEAPENLVKRGDGCGALHELEVPG